MERKRLIFIGNILFFSFMTWGMDKTLSNGDERIIIHEEETALKPTVQTVPNLDLSSMPMRPVRTAQSSSNQQSRKSVANIMELQDQLQRSKSTACTQRKTRTLTRSDGGKICAVVDTAVDSEQPSTLPSKNISLLSRTMAQQLAGKFLDDDDRKMYTEQEVWELIKSCNPQLFAFGQQYKMNLEELEEYAMHLQELDIDPRVFIEHIYSIHNEQKQEGLIQQGFTMLFGNSAQQRLDYAKQYDKIKRKNPDEYKTLMLELLKAAADKADGRTNRSVIADTHTGVQDQQISDQASQIRIQWAGILVAVAGLVTGWVTSALQYFGPHTCNATA